MSSRLLLVLALAVTPLFSGLGCECGPPAQNNNPPTGNGCVRTDVLDDERGCVADDDCACGAHCSFGSCVFDCKVDGDCSGDDVCDDFGRCSPAGQRTEPLRALARTGLTSSQGAVAVGAPDTPYFVQVFTRSGQTSALRLVARGGALVWCPGDDTPSEGCDVDGVGVGGFTIGVGLSAGPVGAVAPAIDIDDEVGTLRSILAFSVQGQAPVVGDPAAASGLYTGSARLGAGAGLLSPVDVVGAENAAANVRHALTATLSLNAAATGTLSIADPSGLVLPESPIVVAVLDGRVNWPTLRWLQIPDSKVELVTEAVDVALAVTDASAFVFEIPLTATGLCLSGEASPLAGLSFSFARTAALPANFVVPTPTADAVPSLAVDRGLLPLAPGDSYDALAVAARGRPLTAGEVLSGPWNRPDTCVQGPVPAVVLADRQSVVPGACNTARLENCVEPRGCAVPAAAADACAIATADLVASNGVAAARFPCAFSYTVLEESCPSFNGQPSQRFNSCLDQELAGNTDCAGFATGPVSSAVCASGVCQDSVCTTPTFEQQKARCIELAGCPGGSATVDVTVDNCAAAATATGCTEQAVNNVREITPLAGLRVVDFFTNTVEQLAWVQVLEKQTTKECVVPSYEPDRDCTIAALCTETPRTTDASAFAAAADGDSGDVLCDGALIDSVPAALAGFGTALDNNVEVPELDACADDLVALAELASRTTAIAEGELNSSRCFAAARLVAAVDMAARGPRSGRAPEPVSLGLAHRLLQETAELQALVAKDALDNYRQQITFAGDDDPRVALALLDKSLSAWGFVLDPRVSGLLLALPGEVLAHPDPRPALGVVPDPDASDGIAEGVSVSLLTALGEQLELLDFALERAWLDGSQDAIAARRTTIASVLRTGSAVTALADTLQARALASVVAGAGSDLSEDDSGLSFNKAYQNARLRYVGIVRRLLDRNEAIDAGLNPLGIEDIDTPIFFAGDIDGDRARFTAVSRFLIGTGPGDLDALATAAVKQAQDALALARLDWRENAGNAADSARREDDIIRRYGELITGYCGAPIDDDSFDIGTYNVLDRPLDVETCFLEAECRPDPFEQVLTAADLGFALCMATRAGDAVGGTDDAELAAVLQTLREPLSKVRVGNGEFPLTLVRFEQDLNKRSAIVRVGAAANDVVIPLNGLGQLGASVSPALLGAAAAGVVQGITNDCRASQQRTLALRPKVNPANCAVADSCRLGDKCAAGVCAPVALDSFLDKVECYYDGAISEQALAVRSAVLEIDVARAELDEFTQRFNIKNGACAKLGQGAAEQERLLREHNDAMADLNIARTVAASVAVAAENARECAAATVGVDASTPITAAATGAAAGGACVAAAVSAAADIAVVALDNVIGEAERKHQASVLAAQNKTDLALCKDDASLELVGVKAQAVRIRQAEQAQTSALINLRGQKSYTAGLWADGNAALEKERRIAQSASLGRFVLSDAAELYIDRFRYAQRLSYLAVRAVESEFQRPESQNRDAVIGAANPDELEDVLRNLATTLNNGTIGGSQPTGLLAVVSLREHVLQLADFSANPDGEQTLTAEERFRLLLTSPRLAVVDERGDYLGQQLPFTLAPLGALGLGNVTGIPIVAQSDCAERLWAVNAAVVGGEDLFDGESSSFTRIDLLQRNTFGSQDCGAGDDPLIVSTTRPAVNLLADYSSASQQNPSPSATAEFARGLMQPYLNVSRADFEREDFAQGSTTQLAGRGLYGDYAIFIPAAALSVDGGPGLKLDAVDDILLRFDYTAVAR